MWCQNAANCEITQTENLFILKEQNRQEEAIKKILC